MIKWWHHKKGCLKLIRSFFRYHTKSLIKIERLSQGLFIFEFQYQNSTKWWCHQWLGLNSLKPSPFLGITPKASQTKFNQIQIIKSKVIHVQIPVPKWENTKKWKKSYGLQNGAIRGLQIGAGFRDYKSGQEGLQIGVVLGILNWGKKITNRDRDFKLEQRDFKLGQRLQIGARRISNRGRDYKLGLGLQIGAEQVLQVLE